MGQTVHRLQSKSARDYMGTKTCFVVFYAGNHFRLKTLATVKAQMATKRAKVGLSEGLRGSKRAQNGPNMPRVPAQRVQDYFSAKPLLTIVGPEIGHFWGPVLWAALAPRPIPTLARLWEVNGLGGRRCKTGPCWYS